MVDLWMKTEVQVSDEGLDQNGSLGEFVQTNAAEGQVLLISSVPVKMSVKSSRSR